MALATQTKTDPIVTAAPSAGDADRVPNPRFAKLPDEATIQRTAEALKAKGYNVHIAATAAEAKRLILELLPEGAEVGQGASTTLEALGVTAEIEGSGRFDAVRPRTRAMDRSTPEGLRAMRKIGGSPDFWLNSVQAVTEDGRLVIASNTGSQLGPIAFGAGTVIFAISVNKIVKDLETAMQRIEEFSLRHENVRMQALYGVDSAVNKLLIVNKEFRPGRFNIVLVREAMGY
jgi:hypothetical protein